MRKRRIPTILLLSSLSLALAGCHDKKEETPPTTKVQSPVPAVVKEAPIAVSASIPASSPSPASQAVAPKSKPTFSQANGTGNLAQEMFDKGDYAMSIVAYCEGYVSHFYPDNKGYAIAFGLNDSLQTKGNMSNLAKPIISEQDQYQAFVAQAGVMQLLPESRIVSLTPEQAIAFVRAMRAQFDSPAKKSLGDLYNKLSQNQKDALMYHSYKTGGFSKYAGLVSALKKYAQEQNDANLKEVLEHIHYSYQLAGKTIQDPKGTLMIQALFTSPEAYGAIIGKNPQKLKDLKVALPALAENHIDTNQPIAPQVDAIDKVGQLNEQAFVEGKKLPLGQNNIYADKETHKKISYAAPAAWY
ncbi:hypothetical protein [Paraburkholderia fungorum]|jgi:hypothetical protein|uniref:hypothetical protein n=1 Tax=Paraburkholderia fungorum TaxID=134537 RepID=UPI000D4980FC|nr:hypothetical protein [Paraburkholderia fungorum]PRZ42895.1 hypothetical protein BX589_15411 [Paraburkholderia fungorum]